MSYITLEDLYHLALVFRRIFVEVFYERNKIGIALVGNLLVFYKFQNMVITFELFFSPIFACLVSFFIFFIGFVIHSRIGHICRRIFFFKGYLETETVGLDKLQFIGFESVQKIFETSGEVMAGIFINRRGIEIDQEIFESEFFHTSHSNIRIFVREIFIEIEDKTIVIEPGTIIVDEIRQKRPDPIDPGSIFDIFGGIEDGLIEISEDCSRSSLDRKRVYLRDPELGKIGPRYFAQNLLEFRKILYSAEIALYDFFQCRILNFCQSDIEDLFF